MRSTARSSGLSAVEVLIDDVAASAFRLQTPTVDAEKAAGSRRKMNAVKRDNDRGQLPPRAKPFHAWLDVLSLWARAVNLL
jgi:hypothetical protein